jgi:hypothetical protein
MLEAAFRRIDVTEAKVDLGSQRLRPGQECGPAVHLHVLDRVVEHLLRLLELVPHQVEPAEHRPGVVPSLHGFRSTRPFDCGLQELGRRGIVAHVAPDGSEHRVDPRKLLVAAAPQPGRPSQ